ncbi:MAG: hypothetical protein ACTSQI_16135, partial [Candidatus Helarchaeota archaeon]
MKQQDKYAFKPTDVHFGNEMPFYMENKKIDNAIDWLITKSLPVMDHFALPARFLLNTLGRSILR